MLRASEPPGLVSADCVPEPGSWNNIKDSFEMLALDTVLEAAKSAPRTLSGATLRDAALPNSAVKATEMSTVVQILIRNSSLSATVQ